MIIDNKNAISSLVATLNIKDNSRLDEYIQPIISNFFKNKNIEVYEPIESNMEISDTDINNTDIIKFDYFYKYILKNIEKAYEIEEKVKYCLTLDKENCKITCPETGMPYDEILMYKKPIFYFIYIDITQIFTYLRKLKKAI